MNRLTPLRERLATHPDDRFARYSLALELKRAGDPEGALTELRELLRRHPGSGAGHYQHGLLLVELDRSEEARQAWEEGLAALRDLADPEARRSLGEIRRALDDLD
jgi:tetratricopeptide (TPR) repeat protein